MVASRNAEDKVRSWFRRGSQDGGLELESVGAVWRAPDTKDEDDGSSTGSLNVPQILMNIDWRDFITWTDEDDAIDLEDDLWGSTSRGHSVTSLKPSTNTKEGHRDLEAGPEDSQGASHLQISREVQHHPPESNGYIQSLRKIKRALHNLTSQHHHYKRGAIAHMRLSHSGRWLVVCHENVCIVYDVKVSANFHRTYNLFTLTVYYFRFPEIQTLGTAFRQAWCVLAQCS